MILTESIFDLIAEIAMSRGTDNITESDVEFYLDQEQQYKENNDIQCEHFDKKLEATKQLLAIVKTW